MSHSTEIEVETSLDKFQLHCGTRLPATAFGIEEGEHKTFHDDEALRVLIALPNVGAGRRQLFEAITDLARDNKQYLPCNWLSITIQHFG